MEPNIELSKTRDFGEIINDTFVFVRQNFKPLLSCFFTFCGFFILAGIVASVGQQIKMVSIVNDTDFSHPVTGFDSFSYFRSFGTAAFLSIVFGWLTYTSIIVTILSFITLYKEKGNVAPVNEEVWGYFKYYFFKVFGSLFINAILLVIGLVFCVVPGIYLYPILGLILPIMIIENTSYGYAFNQSFRIIKDHWWMVFGSLFIMELIVVISSAIVVLPVSLFNVGSMFIHPGRGMHLSLVATIISTVLGQLMLVLYILPIVTLALCYFSLTESKDATGLMGRINQLGSNDTDTTQPAEEY